MFFVMRDFHEHGVTHSRRIGKAMKHLTSAKKLAWIKKGYVLDDSRNLVAQATHPQLPMYLGTSSQ